MTGSTPQPRSFVREPARRAFAFELRETRLQFRDGDTEMSPTYVMLPTGQRCNRLFFCGELTQKEKRGDNAPFYTGRVREPTGQFFVNAGSYQPEAMQQLAKIEPGSFVAVVGKPNVRETPDGAVFVSVRIESIVEVDTDTYRMWVDDTAEKTLERLETFGTTEDSRKAQEFYSMDLASVKDRVHEALSEIGF
jgi:hypothetical protein